jgi:hypothetical protein
MGGLSGHGQHNKVGQLRRAACCMPIIQLVYVGRHAHVAS